MVSEELRPYDGCVLPPQAAAIEELHDWSHLTTDPDATPIASLSTSLVIQLKSGERPRSSDTHDYRGVLGYKELCLLADALKVFENNGYDQVYEWCDALNEAEQAS